MGDPHNRAPAAIRVLLVEDDHDTREMLGLALQMAGFTVLEAGDGASALTLLRSARVDVIVTDLTLPDFDGWQIVRAIRRESLTAYIPIIVLSGSSAEQAEAHARIAGANVFLQKPCDPHDLVTALNLF